MMYFMPVEIEAKFKVESLEPYIERVVQSGGEWLDELEQRDQFFDHADHSLLKADSGLRLRIEKGLKTNRTQLCFKGPRQKGQYKRREEIEFDVSDEKMATMLLEALGFITTLVVEKTRRMAQLDSCYVCLDEVNGLGSFIEIEGPNEAEVEQVAIKLKLNEHRHITSGYVRMLAEKKK
jgi:adenylate cyclase, class 2